MNNDGGRKVGYLAPSVDGQAAAMAEAYTIAGVDPDTIEYIECHGTGTYMGDPIEVSALTQAFRQFTERTQFCRLASVKTNIGHLDTAAGVASLIKAALAVKHGVIPPSLNFEQPNPAIDFASSPFSSTTSPSLDEGQGPTPAGVNSLGVGGTNAHVVPSSAARARELGRHAPVPADHAVRAHRQGLDGKRPAVAQHLRASPEADLADVAFTLHRPRAFDKRRCSPRAIATRRSACSSRRPRRVFTLSALDGKRRSRSCCRAAVAVPTMGADLYDSEPVSAAADLGIELLKKRSGLDLRPRCSHRASSSSKRSPRSSDDPPLTGIFIVE